MKLLMIALVWLIRGIKPGVVHKGSRAMTLVSAMMLAFAHGSPILQMDIWSLNGREVESAAEAPARAATAGAVEEIAQMEAPASNAIRPCIAPMVVVPLSKIFRGALPGRGSWRARANSGLRARPTDEPRGNARRPHAKTEPLLKLHTSACDYLRRGS